MPVQLPRNVVIANRCEIKEVDFVPWLQRRALAVHRIEMPINVRAVIEIDISEQTEPMSADFIGFTDNRINFGRQMLAQQPYAFRKIGFREEKVAARTGLNNFNLFGGKCGPKKSRVQALP